MQVTQLTKPVQFFDNNQQLNQSQQQQQTQQIVYFLTFHHPKLITKTLPIRGISFLYEYRSVITDGSLLKLFQNFQFIYNKVILPQMTPLHEILPKSKDQRIKLTIDIKLVAFDERSAKHHLKHVFDMINNPILYQLYQTYREQSKQIIDEIQSRTNSLQSSILINETLKINPNISEVLDYNISNDLLIPFYKVKKPELIQFISLSGFNPPPPQQKLDGNLFYIHLRVLQSIDYHITASPEGFFLNQSKISLFNPAPIPNKPIYANLFDLIKSLSEKFENRLQDFLAENKLDENDKFLLYFKANNFYKWLQKTEHEHTWNSKKSMSFYLKQATTTQYQDWNQSFLITEKLHPQNAQQINIFDSKHRLYTMFEQAAVEGATMLIDGKIAPLNPLEQKKKQIYIHNKIFFSIANETPYNHSQEKGQEAAPSSSAINTDLINLQILSGLKIADLNVLHMILINYRGYKIIAQCIIPGILSAEQNLCSQYGSIDDGKTIQTNPQFQAIMIKVAQKLHLEDDVKVKDGKGVQKRIAICPDIKGIMGSNQKKYILDLLRLSPRDMNYPEIQNQTCVLRPELIQLFKKYKADRKQAIPKINTNLATQIKLIQNQQTQKQKLLLQQMSKFILDHAIPAVINTLKTAGPSYLTNSQGISQAFHEYGLNLRYLGKVYSHPELENQNQIKIVLERVIVSRCLKHLFRMVMRQTNIMHMNMTLTRVLNCIFGTTSHIELLEQGNMKDNQSQDQNNKDGKKKKKKNKIINKDILTLKQTNNLNNQNAQHLIKIVPSVYLNMKPNELWAIVRKLAKARYDFDIKFNLLEYNIQGIFALPYTKIATLQDTCTIVGMTLEEKLYNIVEHQNILTQNQGMLTLPFHYKNIVNLIPRSKRIKLPIPRQKQILQAATESTQKYKIKQALHLYNVLLELYVSTNNVQNICDIYSRLGKIFYIMTEYKSAIVKQTSALKVYEMGLRPMNYKVVQSYSKLGLYEMVTGNRSGALYFLHKSLLLMLINYGETYPDILVTLANIARIYQQDNCYLKALEILKPVTCKQHINISFCYSSLASLHYDMKDIKKAIQYQTESVGTLVSILSENDSRLLDAKKILKVYHDLALKGSVYIPQQVPGPKSEQKDKIKR